MKKITTLIAMLAIGIGTLKAQDYDELRSEIEMRNSELDEAAWKARMMSIELEDAGQEDAAYELRKVERQIEDAKIILY